ncbi:MAG: DsbA family protein [Hellea sp.]|nr:DsbA family protein [Hellea sp.]
MNGYLKFDSGLKKFAIATMMAVALTACGSGGDETASTTAGSSDDFLVEGDHILGDASAPVTVVEYASVTCGACGNWHNNVYPDFKAKYIDSGKVRFVFREFEINDSMDYAGFTIANCAGEEKFFRNINAQFKRQSAILNAPNIRKAYEELAKSSGISVQQYEECSQDPEWRAKYEAIQKKGKDLGVDSTPTFFINGIRYPGKKMFKIEDFDGVIGPLLSEAEAAE